MPSAEARALFAAGQPLAVTSAALPLVAAEVSPNAHYSALGATLIAIARSPETDPPAAGPPCAWKHDFGGELRLIGGRFERRELTG